MSIGASKCQSEGWAVVQQKGRCEVDEGVTGDFHPQNLAVLVSATNEELNFKQATVLPLCRQGRDNKSSKLIIYLKNKFTKQWNETYRMEINLYQIKENVLASKNQGVK